MKRNILYVLSTIIIIVSQVVYAQETNIPGWPCTGSNSNSIQYINSTLTIKVILVEFSDIKHRNPIQDNLPAYTFSDF